MDEITRYAIYAAPTPGAFADRTAAWLGWDAAVGCAVAHPELDGLPAPVAALTGTPRKYGFHGTLKAPFRLARGTTAQDLAAATAALAARLAPATAPGLDFATIGGFLALVPDGDGAAITALAAEAVRALDPFRAPATADEIARRRPDGLSPRQRALLDAWGYPYVMEEFRFHMTLSGDIGAAAADRVAAVLRPWLGPVLPRPFAIDALCLFGEGRDGRFRILHRYTLSA